ncbi:putative acetyltransferase, GNAT family [Xylaria venustula]|nr:putative acetyltransferase, GNAT family [Xylaria venustula]
MTSRPPNPLGPIVEGGPATRPSQDVKLSGQYVTLVGLSAEHIAPLYSHVSGDENAHLWDYLFDGPYTSLEEFRAAMEAKIPSPDLVTFAIIPTAQPKTADGSDNVVGCASYLRIDTVHRGVEVGSILFSPKLQRSTAATEAMYLMAKHAFEDLGFRRYEWKCNDLNAPSRRAALRLGFTFEGIFRKHMVIKGRSRDTAWFAIIDDDWPGIKKAFEDWLDPGNFDGSGAQRKKLEDFRKI